MGGKLGTLERFKRLAGWDPESEAPYQCVHCRREYGVQYHVCPECGSFSVESVE